MSIFQFTPFPDLFTERLLLRRIGPHDLQALFEMRSDPAVMRHIGRPIPKVRQEVMDLLHRIDTEIEENKSISWAITRKGETTMIGTMGFYRAEPEHFRAEVGYMISSVNWGQGIASEAIQAAIRYGFEHMSLNSIEGKVSPENTGSIRVLEKSGFIREGYFKENYFSDGQFMDTAVYSLLKSKAL